MAMFIGRAAPVHPPIPMTGQTMSEKVLARSSHAASVRPGQMIAERGYAHPWDLVIGSDSHTNMVGAVGAFAAGIGATDTAAVMAKGQLWLRVPETMRVDIHGTLGERTGAKDVILKVIGTTG